MDLLDASALIAFLTGEPEAAAVRRVLAAERSGTTAVHLGKVADMLSRSRATAIEETRRAIESIPGLQLLPITVAAGWRAGDLLSCHSHGTHGGLSLADCLLIAIAGSHDRIVVRDGPLARVARAEGIEVMSLSA